MVAQGVSLGCQSRHVDETDDPWGWCSPGAGLKKATQDGQGFGPEQEGTRAIGHMISRLPRKAHPDSEAGLIVWL